MAEYEFRQCTNPGCQLRFPIDITQHRGDFCPRCGSPLTFQRNAISHEMNKAEFGKAGRSISVILDNIRSVFNVGSIFRTSDAVGVKQLFLCGITPSPNEHAHIQKTALGAELSVPWQYHPNALHLALRFYEKDYHLIGLEAAPQAVRLYQFRIDIKDQRPIILVIGNERAGVDPEVLEICESVIALPMSGKKRSLNVAVAFGAAAYWLSFGQP
jgi:tRNA G18 (ribose-2'-O)-methylase SpoU